MKKLTKTSQLILLPMMGHLLEASLCLHRSLTVTDVLRIMGTDTFCGFYVFRAAFVYFLLLVIVIKAESSLRDDCKDVPGRNSRVGDVLVSSSNIASDSTDAKNFNGDVYRYKRENSKPGIVSYTYERGFSHIEVVGFVYDPNVNRSWSVTINGGHQPIGVNGTIKTGFNITETNVKKYEEKGGRKKWTMFRVSLPLKQACPQKINIVISGTASNNEYPGWGVQLSEIQLEKSWYDKCRPQCFIKESTCKLDKSLKQFEDNADDVLSLYSYSNNIVIDRSNPKLYFNDDRARFKRSNKKVGNLVYRAEKGIRTMEIEYFQYQDFKPQIAVFPYINQHCQPIRLIPELKKGAGSVSEQWTHGIAYFDLRSLPFCPTHAAIHIIGGDQGWELQISKVIMSVLGEVNESGRSSESTSSTKSMRGSSSGGGGGLPDGWWIWLLAFCGATGFFIVASLAVRSVVICLGEDDRHIYHISNWIPCFRSHLDNSQRGPQIVSPVSKRTIQMMRAEHNSFSFAPTKSNSIKGIDS